MFQFGIFRVITRLILEPKRVKNHGPSIEVKLVESIVNFHFIALKFGCWLSHNVPRQSSCYRFEYVVMRAPFCPQTRFANHPDRTVNSIRQNSHFSFDCSKKKKILSQWNRNELIETSQFEPVNEHLQLVNRLIKLTIANKIKGTIERVVDFNWIS